MRLLRNRIDIKTPDQVRHMRRAGLVVADIHAALREAVRPGVTTGELDAMLADSGLALDVVLEITADAEVVVDRLLKRATEQNRADDTESVIRRRLEVYAEATEPLAALYEGRGLLVRVDGTGDVDEVTERIMTALASRATA